MNRKRPEFLALASSDVNEFKKELFRLLEDRISTEMAKLYLKESSGIINNIVLEKKKPVHLTEQKIAKQVPVYMPITELNDSINFSRTVWLTAKDGSQLEVTPKMAKYLAELYNSLNKMHKEKLVNLILESDHGFKKAVKTAEKLYGDKNGHQ